MTLPRFVWMLTECGDVAALPPGTSGADALPTGPVYELALRTRPSVKLFYTHKLSSNVNAKASSLAGHVINGDVCLIFTPTPSSFSSPAVLLDSLLRPSSSTVTTIAAAAATSSNPPPSAQLSRRKESNHDQHPTFQSPHVAPPGKPTSAPAEYPSGHADFSHVAAPQLSRTALTPGQGPQQQPQQLQPQQQLQQRWRQVQPCPQQRQMAMRAILGSRNANMSSMNHALNATPSTTATSTTKKTHITDDGNAPSAMGTGPTATFVMASATSVTTADEPADVSGPETQIPAAATAVAAIASSGAPHTHWLRRPNWDKQEEEQEEPPCKSARSSGEFHAQLRRTVIGRGSLDPWVAAAPMGVMDIGGHWQQQRREEGCREEGIANVLHPQKKNGEQEVEEEEEEDIGGKLWMELDDDPHPHPHPHPPKSAILDTALKGRSDTRADVKAAAAATKATATARGVRAAPTSAATDTATDTAAATDTEVEVPWGELGSDAVVCIAMQLPQQASQAQAMAAVCRGWRAALLAHMPLLRRIAFSLDLSRPFSRYKAADPAGKVHQQGTAPPSCTSATASPSAAIAAGTEAAVAAAAGRYIPAATPPVMSSSSTHASTAACVGPSTIGGPSGGTSGGGRGSSSQAPSCISCSLDCSRSRCALSDRSGSFSGASAAAAQGSGSGVLRLSCRTPVDEQEVLATAISKQHGAGAFLLPSQGSPTAQQQQRQQEARDGAESSRWHENHAQPLPGAAVAADGSPLLLRNEWGSSGILSLPRLLLAAAQASNPSAQLVLAQLLEASDDPRGALRWWRKLAQWGDVMATFKLGMASYDGSHGMQPDPETAHLWLGRTVRSILNVEHLSAICMDGHQGGCLAASATTAASSESSAASSSAAIVSTSRSRARTWLPGARISPALKAMVSALDAPRLHMLAWSSIVLGYLDFDGVAGRSVWGMGDRSEAVRLFRLAEGCGLAEASAVLGWLYNTGQY